MSQPVSHPYYNPTQPELNAIGQRSKARCKAIIGAMRINKVFRDVKQGAPEEEQALAIAQNHVTFRTYLEEWTKRQ